MHHSLWNKLKAASIKRRHQLRENNILFTRNTALILYVEEACIMEKLNIRYSEYQQS